MTLRLRRRIIPKTLVDKGSILFLFTTIPLVYTFEVFVALPELHEPGSYWHNIHFFGGTIELFALVSNIVAAILIDSSVPKKHNLLTAAGKLFCFECNVTVPPRSHHCSNCESCILRRDHHCMFTGNCVGLYSQRFFLAFLMHLFIGAFYSTYINFKVVIPRLSLRSLLDAARLLLPAITLVLDKDKPAGQQIEVLVTGLAIVGMFIAIAFVLYHGRNTLMGQTAFEAGRNDTRYRQGYIDNIKEVMGSRWYIAWIHPLIPSPLPYDGTQWEFKER